MAGLVKLVPVSAGLLVGLAGCAQQARYSHSMDVRAAGSPVGAIEARTENGSVTVSRANVDGVEVHADIRAVTQARADATVVTADRQADGSLLIAVRWPDGKRQSNEACSLDIKAPGAVAVRLFTSNGDIDAKGMAGDSEFKTSNGSVVVTDHAGSVRAESSNGDIDVGGVAGAVKVHTSNGGVKIALGTANPGPVDAESSNGTIRLEVGPGFAGVVDAGTSNGTVEASGGPLQIVRGDRTHATVTFGAGGARSTLRTSNGSVMVVGK